jgi:hypothetical protein
VQLFRLFHCRLSLVDSYHCVLFHVCCRCNRHDADVRDDDVRSSSNSGHTSETLASHSRHFPQFRRRTTKARHSTRYFTIHRSVGYYTTSRYVGVDLLLLIICRKADDNCQETCTRNLHSSIVQVSSIKF